jgi:hypothetical protein
MVRFLAALALLASPAQADMLDGADDPTFRTALTTLLAKDDPAAVAALRDLAEAGNMAALVTLPFALQWVPPQGTLKEKNAQRMVGGIKAQDAASDAHGATRLWNNGAADPVDGLPDRATGLVALGETDKAAYLMSLWVNQTGGLGDTLPPVILSDAIPASLSAFALTSRLTNAVYQDGSATDEAARLLSLMREDQLVGWLTHVAVTETYPDVFATLGNPLAGTGLSATATETRIADAEAVWAVYFGSRDGDPPVFAAKATRARQVLAGRAELLPVTRLCLAHCPTDVPRCEAAALAYPGHPFVSFWQPFADVLDPLEFAASDRGIFALIHPRTDPAAAADRAAAETLDACYAGLLAHRDTLRFGP